VCVCVYIYIYIYRHGGGRINNCLNRLLHEVMGYAPARMNT